MALLGLNYLQPFIKRNFIKIISNQIALISTSKKSKDTLVYPENLFPKKQPPPPKTVEDFADTKNPKSWMSYGYDLENYEEDRRDHRDISFTLMTFLLCGSVFIVAYYPDLRDRDWTMREAYLELHRREKNGLPLIDKNLIDPSKIELPSDEELGDTEIII